MPRPFDYPYEARSLRHDGKWGNKARLWTLPRARKPSSPSRSAGPFYTYLTAVSHTLVVRLWLHKTVCVAVAPPVSCTACFASQGKRERHDGTALVSALHNDHRVRWLGDLIQRSAIPGDLESETSPPTRRRPIPPAGMSQTLFSDTPLHNATPRRLPTKNPTAAPRFRGFAGARHGWRANMPATGSCSAPLFALPDVVSGARAGFSQPRTPQAAAVGSPQEEGKKNMSGAAFRIRAIAQFGRRRRRRRRSPLKTLPLSSCPALPTTALHCTPRAVMFPWPLIAQYPF